MELPGVLLKLHNPLARLSHTTTKGHVFSCLGELLWYLAKSNNLQFISYYIKRYKEESEDGKTVFGAYGPRLFGIEGPNQIENVINQLRKGPTTRRAVIQIFQSTDVEKRKIEVPCTCTFQFLLRRQKLHMITNMRSNDAFKGLPHDIFTFTMIQEIIARSLDVEVGFYKHSVGSLHLYEEDVTRAEQYLAEGWQSTTRAMPPMPVGNPWLAISQVLRAESAIRKGRSIPTTIQNLQDYWQDLVRLLEIFRHSKDKKPQKVTQIRKRMSHDVYDSYIRRREAKGAKTSVQQLRIEFPSAESLENP